jgi:hypothetical protein
MDGMTALLDRIPFGSNDARPREDIPPAGRDPAHALYRHAAELLASAQSLEAAARPDGAVAATAPTLACMETTLAALATAVGRLRGQVLERLSDPVLPNDDLRPQRVEIAAALERLAGVLDQSSFTANRALTAIEPVTDELRAI